MRYAVLGFSACSLALSSAPAAAADGLVLAPSAEWQYNEYEDRCRASREFGDDKNRTALWIEQGGVEANYNLTLIGRPLRHPYGGGIHVRFGEEPEFIRSYIAAVSSQGRPVLRMYGVTITQPRLTPADNAPAPEPAFDVAQADRITELNLRTSIRQPLRLELGPMIEPLGFLGLCGAKLSGVLSNAGRPLTGEATAPVAIGPDTWLTPTDYPAYLVRAGMGGKLETRITVNREGKASSCYVAQSDRPQLFDDTVCLALLKRAQFEPARNGKGEPVASYYFYAVTFEVK
ncbi:MAG TPA: energy transducer TonB [Erythrobacter sp.]|nr:energy transducer TonB [Erythrobacter sp.]